MMIKTADGSYLSVGQFKERALRSVFGHNPPKELLARHGATYAMSEISLEEMCIRVRSKRNVLLQETDWIVIKSYERGQNIPAEWELYRQALRDITTQAGFPYSVVWPIKPE